MNPHKPSRFPGCQPCRAADKRPTHTLQEKQGHSVFTRYRFEKASWKWCGGKCYKQSSLDAIEVLLCGKCPDLLLCLLNVLNVLWSVLFY